MKKQEMRLTKATTCKVCVWNEDFQRWECVSFDEAFYGNETPWNFLDDEEFEEMVNEKYDDEYDVTIEW